MSDIEYKRLRSFSLQELSNLPSFHLQAFLNVLPYPIRISVKMGGAS